MGERKDLEVYSGAVRLSNGSVSQDWPDEIPKEFFSYVERGTPQYLDGRKEPFPTSYNYKQWLKGG